MSDAEVIRTYGNWRAPVRAGFGKLSFGASMGLVAGLVMTVFINATAGLLPALGFLVLVGMSVAAVTLKDAHGVSIVDRIGEVMRFWRAKSQGKNLYRSGATAPRIGDGAARLPGVLSKVSVSEHRDAYQRPFALIKHPSGTVAVVIASYPEGDSLVDRETLDQQVARWGLWLTQLSQETGIVAASVTVESVPDSGTRLRREVEQRIDPAAPQLAQLVLEDVIDSYKEGAAQVRAWITITFDPGKMGVKRRDESQIARDIGSRLPGLTQGLGATGGGALHLVAVNELCRIARVAFDPASEALFDQAAAENSQVDIDFSQVGPTGAVAGWDTYRHDSGLSRTWVMTAPPRGAVQSSVLSRLIAPSRDVDRKRVTLLYQPISAGRAPDLVEKDVNQALAGVASSNRPTQRKQAELRSAQQVAREEADGASLVDFGIVITATTQDGEIEDVAAAINALSSSARLQVRPAYGAQDTAFAMGLPFGLRPSSDSLVKWSK